MGERAKLHLLLPVAPHRLHYRLNTPPPPPSVEKLPSAKPVPGAKKVGRLGTAGIQGIGQNSEMNDLQFIRFPLAAFRIDVRGMGTFRKRL